MVRRGLGLAVLAAAAVYLARVVSGPDLLSAGRALLRDPLGVLLALAMYGCAFGLRTWSWCRVLPGLSPGLSWAALHVSLLGNHVLPFRLGEALRVTTVLRRTSLPAAPVIASTVTLRSADLLAVALLALVAAPALVTGLTGPWIWPLAAALALATLAGAVWLGRLPSSAPGAAGDSERSEGGRARRRGSGTALLPVVFAAAAAAWVLEAAVVYEVARLTGVGLTPPEAVAVTAVTIAAQTVAVTPGGFGSYEAAATAALTALGVASGPAFAVALLTHALKTAYSLVVGGVALVTPTRLRLPRTLPPRPHPLPVAPHAPVVAFVPVFNEEATVAEVVKRLPAVVAGRPLVTIVIDDGSSDASASLALDAGATVVSQPHNLGLGAAVRRGLAEAVRLDPAAVVYLDADLEYFPEDVESLAEPVLSGEADYVVGSRFAGTIDRMLPHRRFGNRVLTAWVRWMTRHAVTDGQSGYRAFSPGAARAAEVIHDYNYAQILTLDLLAKGYRYHEVPIRYAFRATGESFVKLGRYLRKVIPAVHRELNSP
ncbi:flippase-like domain-containing protein [Planomonospora sp. ID67723]|uniref:lysylphosphatidylglycerol synthase domain-containing protein n=1 Tax=Planomonospora sp. ID67723 TaxID=2738134 RepID=UPI0018C423AE|nr:lysylphosphatidylglycerol synthase domain-containing protein [Planomonospora sp. ID67723]MBG0832244.1 flippase-like domain-containing protein [Planomonospora sp. ID67723]